MQNFEKLRLYWPNDILEGYFETLEKIREEVKEFLKQDEEDELINQLRDKFIALNKKIKNLFK